MTSDLRKRWGRAIRAQRERVGLSQAELARRLDVKRQAVYQWETGETLPDPTRHVAIAHVLRIHPQLLFTYPEAPRDEQVPA